MKQISSLTIIGKRWFQKTWGNTYHSVQVFVNDEVLECNFRYGYGDQYMQTAEELLLGAGYDLKGERINSLTLREKFKGNYSVSDVSRKKDL